MCCQQAGISTSNCREAARKTDGSKDFIHQNHWGSREGWQIFFPLNYKIKLLPCFIGPLPRYCRQRETLPFSPGSTAAAPMSLIKSVPPLEVAPNQVYMKTRGCSVKPGYVGWDIATSSPCHCHHHGILPRPSPAPHLPTPGNIIFPPGTPPSAFSVPFPCHIQSPCAQLTGSPVPLAPT